MVDYREVFGISDLSSDAKDGAGVKVAVLDTGIPDISDILVCLSHNCTADSSRDCGHATFIGSLLFGKGPVKGLCPAATACFIKVFDRLVSKPETTARAIEKAIEWNVDIINMSLGFSRSMDCPSALRKSCEKAISKGIILVAASGNDGGKVMWPAALPGVICVGSSDGSDKEDFSNYGEVDFVTAGKDLQGQDSTGKVVLKSGTSFSSAIIAGLLALILAKRKCTGKSVSLEEVVGELISSCKDIGDSGWDERTGHGYPFAGIAAVSVGLPYPSIFGKIKMLIKKVVGTLKRRIRYNEI